MAEHARPAAGTIGWFDLTVPDAPRLRDFYRDVVGWSVGEVDMGGYDDYMMTPPGGDRGVAGVCHARGANADLPPAWLAYLVVEDLDASLAQVGRLGGAVVAGPKTMGEARFAVIRDPAGAVVALYQP